MTATGFAVAPAKGRTYSEPPAPSVKANRVRVIQLGSYPAINRGARSNLLTIHERLKARGHQSVVIDLTPFHHVKQNGVFYPRSIIELGRLLLETPADVIHLHLGSALSLPKLALAALVNRLPDSKKICTLHLGGHFVPKKGLRASSWGLTGMVLRQFDTLIAVNPEVASFFHQMGVPKNRTQLITPFPRLRLPDSPTLSNHIETFCRQHTPLIVSVGRFEPGSELPKQFDILSKVRERYPSAGLIVIGGGTLHFQNTYARALHQDCNHIAMTGSLSEASTRELIHRANVLLRAGDNEGESFAVHEALKANIPMVAANVGPRRSAAYLSAVGDVEAASLQVLRSLQITRPQYEDVSAALTDGIDDIIRLYKLLSPHKEEAFQLPAVGYQWPSMG